MNFIDDLVKFSVFYLMMLKEKVKNPEATNMLHFVICCCGFSSCSRNSRTTAVDGGSV